MTHGAADDLGSALRKSPVHPAVPSPDWGGGLHQKWPSIGVILLAQVAAMAVWFASAAAASALARSTPLTGFEGALLTSAVQAGFVLGALVSAFFGLPDRFDPRRIFMVSALAGGLASAALAVLPPAGLSILGLRFLTGTALAGVYPIGMRLVATWASGDLGLLIGLLVGALTLGSASPLQGRALGPAQHEEELP